MVLEVLPDQPRGFTRFDMATELPLAEDQLTVDLKFKSTTITGD